MDMHLADFSPAFTNTHSASSLNGPPTTQPQMWFFRSRDGPNRASHCRKIRKFSYSSFVRKWTYGVLKQSIKSFRTIFDLMDEKQFFQTLDGDQR